MAGLGISDLPSARAPYRLDRDTRRADGTIRFEPMINSVMEDQWRANSQRWASKSSQGSVDAEAALNLAKRLEVGAETRIPPMTPASSLYMRQQRKTIVGNIWPASENADLGPHATVTLIPRDLTCTASQLDRIDPTVLKHRLQVALNRAGVTAADGYLLGGLHGEFDSFSKVFSLHWHCIAGGDKLKAIERLRDTQMFSRDNSDASDILPTNCSRIRVSRKPLTNLPDPLTYVVQSFWPDRTRAEFGGEGTGIRRRGMRARIPEPYHAQWLLWMDRWSINDLTLLNGLRVARTGFQLTVMRVLK